MIWVIFVVLAFGAVAIMGVPILRRTSDVVAAVDSTPSVLLDQLDEVKRDLDRNLISAVEAKAAEQELKRRILLESRKRENAPQQVSSDGRFGIILAILFVPAMAFGYYTYMGSPQIASMSNVRRAEAQAELEKVTTLSAELSARLSNDPQGGPSEGWMLLGQTYSRMGRHADAANAFDVVAKRPDADSSVLSMLAESLIYAEQGVVTPEAEVAIKKAIDLDPSNPAATYYLAVGLSQKGAPTQAYNILLDRLQEADGFYPWMESYVLEANRIGARIGKRPLTPADFRPELSAPGPTSDDIANAQDMSDDDRQAFIASMVERLATRLEDESDDLDGWIRLGNAYRVLGQNANAVAAFERADLLLPTTQSKDPRQAIVQDALTDLQK